MLAECIGADGDVVALTTDSTDIVAEAERLHRTSATVTAALGRLLTAASLMGSSLKAGGASVTLRVNGGGPVGSLIAVGESSGDARGYAENPGADLPSRAPGKLDVGGVVGRDGTLSVVKSFGMKTPYTGFVPLRSGEIAEDVAAYYAESEQVPTVCTLGVLVDTDLSVRQAGGFLIQLLPGAGDDVAERLERNISDLPPVTSMMESGLSHKDIILRALDGFSPRFAEEKRTRYRCSCSRQRVAGALKSLAKDELLRLAGEADKTDVACEFCGKSYEFTGEELLNMAGEK